MPSECDLLGGPVQIYNDLNDRCPAFIIAAQQACEVQAFAEECSTRIDVPRRVNEAFGSVLVQVLNDWLDLLQAASFGMGRPAFRSARSIFELSLFGLDLFDDEGAADRYLDHDVINQLQLIEHSGFDGLSGPRLRAARHRRQKDLMRLRPLAAELLERYGRGYGFTWTTESVRKRAERASRLGEYAYYRYASGVAHGSVSGRDGSLLRYNRGDEQREVPVYRLGSNLYFCVQALHYGLASFSRFVKDVRDRGIASADDLLHRLGQLEQTRSDFESEMLLLHHGISPDSPP